MKYEPKTIELFEDYEVTAHNEREEIFAKCVKLRIERMREIESPSFQKRYADEIATHTESMLFLGMADSIMMSYEVLEAMGLQEAYYL